MVQRHSDHLCAQLGKIALFGVDAELRLQLRQLRELVEEWNLKLVHDGNGVLV